MSTERNIEYTAENKKNKSIFQKQIYEHNIQNSDIWMYLLHWLNVSIIIHIFDMIWTEQ